MSRISIRVRLFVLTCILLSCVVGTAGYLNKQLSNSSDVLRRESAYLETLGKANAAHRAFAELKYWLTDLSVSQLVRSENEVRRAEDELDRRLGSLHIEDRESILLLRTLVAEMKVVGMKAVDAYTNDRRVVGNSLMAGMRAHAAQIDAAFNKVIEQLNRQAETANAQSIVSSRRAAELTAGVITATTLLGLLLTTLVIRSITGPLQRLNLAIHEISLGNFDVEIPRPGPSEVAAMAHTLTLFRGVQQARQAAEAGRQESEQRYRKLIELFPDSIYVQTAGEVVFANRAAGELFGTGNPDDLVGKDSLDFFHPENRDLIRERRKRLEKQETVESAKDRMVRADGSSFYGDVTATNVVWGEQDALLLVVRDITERLQLRESDYRLRAILDHSPIPIYLTDTDFRVLMVNRRYEELFGVDRDSVVGRTSHGWLPAPLADEIERYEREVIDDARTVEHEFAWVRNDGDSRVMATTKFPVLDGDGRVIAVGSIDTDISDQKRGEEALRVAKEEAEEANRSKSQFLAKMSHEIRTPMNGVLGMAELLSRSRLEPRQKHLVDTIRQSGDLLLNVINEILDFSKIEAGKLTLHIEDVRLIDIVEDVIDLLAEPARLQELELFHQFDGDIPDIVRGDGNRLKQILTNLVGNAIKFTEAGEVVLRTDVVHRMGNFATVRFEVRDTGVGIPAEYQAGIFEAFQQADNTTSRKFGGTGLGLAISNQLVAMMGGDMDFASEEGSGSKFWFDVSFEIVAETTAADPTSRRTLNGLTILVVDDHGADRDFVASNISRWGMRMERAGDAATALEILKHYDADGPSVDLVIIDVKMAEDGMALAREIRALPAAAKLPILLLSSTEFLGGDPAESIGRPGAVSTKPLRRSELFNRIVDLTGPQADPVDCSGPLPGRGISEDFGAMVLVAEDNLVNQEISRENLLFLGCRVDLVEDGKCAVAAYTDNVYDLVLMDCQMPEMDGFEATKAIRAIEQREPARGHTPIVALTAHAMEGDRDECLAAGMDDYMVKPFKTEALKAMISRWVKTDGPADAPVENRPPPAETEQADEDIDGVLDPATLAAIRKLGRDDGPNLLKRVASRFLEAAPADIQAIHDAAKRNDLEALRDAAHRLKSSSANLGATRLSEISKEIEAMARAGKTRDLGDRVADLDSESGAVRRSLEKLAG